MGTQTTKYYIIFFILVLVFGTILPTDSRAQNMTFSISMLHGEQQTHFDRPVLVAGIWHYINITLDTIVDELTLRVYKGLTPPAGNKNETNYYEWQYDSTSLFPWNDFSGYGTQYIQQELCSYTDTLCSFCIGIEDFMPNIVGYYENWTIEISLGGTILESENIVVEKPKTGVSLSKPSSIIFHVDPFTIMDAQGDNFFKIGNIGNIPLSVYFDSEKYVTVEISDVNKMFLPGEITAHYVTVHSKSWPPGFKNIDIELNGSYPQSYFIDTNATVTLYTSFIIDVPQLVIYVGHSNYRIDEIQGTGITFQYIEKLNMREGESQDITAYVSGNGEVTVEIWADEKNLSALKLYDGTTETTSPLSFTSTNTSERELIVTVKALSEGRTGILTYRVTGNGATKVYTTQVTIGPPASSVGESTSPTSIMQIVVIVIVALVIIYMIVTYIRNKKR